MNYETNGIFVLSRSLTFCEWMKCHHLKTNHPVCSKDAQINHSTIVSSLVSLDSLSTNGGKVQTRLFAVHMELFTDCGDNGSQTASLIQCTQRLPERDTRGGRQLIEASRRKLRWISKWKLWPTESLHQEPSKVGALILLLVCSARSSDRWSGIPLNIW